jgi:hypothetical protein
MSALLRGDFGKKEDDSCGLEQRHSAPLDIGRDAVRFGAVSHLFRW